MLDTTCEITQINQENIEKLIVFLAIIYSFHKTKLIIKRYYKKGKELITRPMLPFSTLDP